MARSKKYVAAVALLKQINPDLVAVADHWQREMVYTALQNRGYTWDSYKLAWFNQRAGGIA